LLACIHPQDDEFVAYVQSGELVGKLDDEDICQLTASRC
jgi:hypothetical protein